MMKKLSLTGLLLLVLLFTACSKDEVPPIIDGVTTQVTITVGESFDAMKGLIVTDNVDGDLLDRVQLSTLSGLEAVDGVYTPEEAGTYYITYSVMDKAGNESKAYTDLVVLEKLIEEVFLDFDFNENGNVNHDDWSLILGDNAKGNLTDIPGAVMISIEDGGNESWEAKYAKNNISIEKGATYDVVIRAKSDIPVLFHFVANDTTTDWQPLGTSAWNLEMSQEVKEYKLSFIAENDSDAVEAFFEFGGDMNKTPFEIIIDEIKIIKTMGEFTPVEVLYLDGTNTNGFATRRDENIDTPVESEISTSEEKILLDITNFGTATNPWEFDLYYGSDIDLVEGETYSLKFDYDAEKDQFAELCIEDSNMDWQIRAGFDNMTFIEGQNSHEFTFIASRDIEDMFIKFSLGKSDGNTSNKILIDNIRFEHLEGDRITEEKVINFALEGLPYASFHAGNGQGTLYNEDGLLKYQVTSFSATDWENKVFFPGLTLPGDSLYKIRLVAKSDKATKGIVFLNVEGKWDPRIVGEINLTEEYQEIILSMTEKIMFEMNFELLMQFGFETNEAPAAIEFKEIQVIRLN